jgi:hypothetical protein
MYLSFAAGVFCILCSVFCTLCYEFYVIFRAHPSSLSLPSPPPSQGQSEFTLSRKPVNSLHPGREGRGRGGGLSLPPSRLSPFAQNKLEINSNIKGA